MAKIQEITEQDFINGNKLIAEFCKEIIGTEYHRSFDGLLPVLIKVKDFCYDSWLNDIWLESAVIKFDLWNNEAKIVDTETGQWIGHATPFSCKTPTLTLWLAITILINWINFKIK